MSKRDAKRDQLFTRRALILGASKLTLFGALAARLYQLQVLEGERYTTLAEDNRINLKLLVPPRGRILDRFGEPLAVNRLNYRVVLVSEQARHVEDVLERLGRLIEVTENDRKRVLREVRRKRPFVPVMVREDLNWEDVAKVEFNAPDLPGVSIDVGQSRFYPHSDAVGHILGYVGAASKADLKNSDDPLLELPDFRVGRNGVEKTYDQALRGSAGSSQVEVNAVGRIIRELNRVEGLSGREIELTIDIQLQEYVLDRLGDESAAAIVMNVHNGDLLAMASVPGFDPNMFSTGLNVRDWEELSANPKTPLANKAIAGQYSPGSTFKMITALAALDAGAITPRTVVSCPGHMDLGDHRFHCWKKGGHGAVDLNLALMYSCDVFFYEAARRVGIDKLAQMARRLGFGGVLKIDIPGEKPGLMPTRDWLMKTFNQPWTQGLTLISGIGQGSVLATPLQLATMTARLCNGGVAVTPHVTRRIGGEAYGDRIKFQSLGLNPQALQAMMRAMDGVTNSVGGTAYKSRIQEVGFEMAGKTGTSQVRRISLAEREKGVKKNEDLPWRERDHALFVAFAPVSAPRYACAVVVEHGGGGSSVAAPIVRDILLEAQKRDLHRKQSPGRDGKFAAAAIMHS